MRLNGHKTVVLGPEGGKVEIGVVERPVEREGRHLGHILVSPWDPAEAWGAIMRKAHEMCEGFLNRPLPLPLRCQVHDSLWAGMVAYMGETVAPAGPMLDTLHRWSKGLLLGLADVPAFLPEKVIYAPKPVGLGCRHLPSMLLGRVLDVAHKTLLNVPVPEWHGWAYANLR